MANNYLFEIKKLSDKWLLHAWARGGKGSWFGRKAFRNLDKKDVLDAINELMEGEKYEIRKKQAKKKKAKEEKDEGKAD